MTVENCDEMKHCFVKQQKIYIPLNMPCNIDEHIDDKVDSFIYTVFTLLHIIIQK